MQLRPRQKVFVDKIINRLNEHGVTLAIAPTGFGKTVVLAHIIKHYNLKTCVIAHRNEIVEQNLAKVQIVNPDKKLGIFNAKHKNTDDEVIFAMIQSLIKIKKKLVHFDLLIIDEAHHAIATSYQEIIMGLHKINPNLKLLGLTATPLRGDGQNLLPIFLNVADSVSYKELFADGLLVKPKVKVIDFGASVELGKLNHGKGEYNMKDVDDIVNRGVCVKRQASIWIEHGENRQSVAFCCTISHANNVRDELLSRGVKAASLSCDMSKRERDLIHAKYNAGEITIICNVGILTEGWDSPITSCIILLIPVAHKGRFIQICGRAFRLHEGKEDCLIIDTGISVVKHGNLEQEVEEFEKRKLEGVEAPKKLCPECGIECFQNAQTCDCCGYEFTSDKEPPIDQELKLKEFELIKDRLETSHYLWLDREIKGYQTKCCRVNDFTVLIFFLNNEKLLVFMYDGLKLYDNYPVERFSLVECIKEFDKIFDKLRKVKGWTIPFIKSSNWLYRPASVAQIELLAKVKKCSQGEVKGLGLTKYKALIEFLIETKENDLFKIIEGKNVK